MRAHKPQSRTEAQQTKGYFTKKTSVCVIEALSGPPRGHPNPFRDGHSERAAGRSAWGPRGPRGGRGRGGGGESPRGPEEDGMRF